MTSRGLLLAPHLDAVFDAGYITLGDDGNVVVSPKLDVSARRLLALEEPQRVRILPRHRTYLPWHRAGVFRG